MSVGRRWNESRVVSKHGDHDVADGGDGSTVALGTAAVPVGAVATTGDGTDGCDAAATDGPALEEVERIMSSAPVASTATAPAAMTHRSAPTVADVAAVGDERISGAVVLADGGGALHSVGAGAIDCIGTGAVDCNGIVSAIGGDPGDGAANPAPGGTDAIVGA